MTPQKQGTLQCNGTNFHYVESGTGEPIVILPASDDQTVDDLARDLAVDHRVIVVRTANVRARQTPALVSGLSAALRQLPASSAAIIGILDGVESAIALAIASPDHVQRLILLSPPLSAIQTPGVNERLKDVHVPTLVLVGTRDRSGARECGRLCREHIPVCHLLLIYEAGQMLLADRREACLTPIREFLTQGEGFIVTHESQVIRP